jgi:multidrug/hemolysin transport system permease protein
MTTFIKRNLKLFFRDKSAVFFSLLAVIIIIGLYALFLGDVWLEDLSDVSGARFLMDSWLIAGLLAVTSVTTTLGAFGIMVEDKTKKIAKDFYSAPIKRSSITGGYLFSVVIIGVIMSIVALVLSEIYVVANGGLLIGAVAAIKVFGIILLATLSNTALMCFIVSFFKSQNAYATASTIIGTLIGFVAGIYLPIGNLPEAVQTVVKVFPISHAAVLLRQVVMGVPIDVSFAGAPQEALDSFNSMLGISYKFGDFTVTPLMSIAYLVLTGALFYGLAMMKMAKKRV